MSMIFGTENSSRYLNASVSPNHVEKYLTQEERVLLTVLLSLVGILGFFVNAIVVYTITTVGSYMYVDVPVNIFILSQAIADLGAVATLPIYISHMYSWNWEVVYIILTLAWISSLGSLFLLTLNRLISVACPLKYPRIMTPFRARLLVVAIWLAALAISLLHMIGYLVYSNSSFFNYGRYYIIALIFAVVLSNVYMFRASQKQARKIKGQNRVVTGMQRHLREDLKSVKTLGLVAGTFLLSSLPITLVIFVYGGDKEDVQFQRWSAFLAPLFALNPVFDPLIYYLRSSEFRAFYLRFRRLRRQDRIQDSTFSEIFTLNRVSDVNFSSRK